MVRAIMHGCNGHMGRVITDICKNDENIEIVAGIDLFDGIENDYPVFKTLDDCDVDADVIIDFCNLTFCQCVSVCNLTHLCSCQIRVSKPICLS